MFFVLLYAILWLCPLISLYYIRRYNGRRNDELWSKNMMFALGNRGWHMFKKVSMNDFIDLYKEFLDTKINCLNNILQSTILVRDISMISKLVQSQSDYYEDELCRTDNSNSKIQQLSSQSFFLKHLPAHFYQMKLSIKNTFYYVDLFGRTEFDAKELFSRFTCDVLAYSILGRLHNSFDDDENALYILAVDMADYNDIGSFNQLFSHFFPSLSTGLGLTEKSDYILDSVRTLINFRKLAKKVDHDYIHFLLDLEKESRTKMDVAEHVLSLYMYSHEICTNMLCYMAYELALNPKVQQTLYAEIETLMLQCGGKPGPDEIMMMEYLHMVVSETLRKWPVIPVATTVCKKHMMVDECIFWKGEHIVIPIAGIHRDPEFFPKPTRFDPERFNEDNKQIKPNTFYPFGLGLKTRLGSSLAFMQAKVFFVFFLAKFQLSASPLTSHIEYITEKKSFTVELQTRKQDNPDNQFYFTF